MSAKPLTPEIAGWERCLSREDGAQVVDGEWYRPRFGCDSLAEALDATRAELAAAVEALRSVEYGASVDGPGTIGACPACGRLDPSEAMASEAGHASVCIVGIVLASLSDAAKARDRALRIEGAEMVFRALDRTGKASATYRGDAARIVDAKEGA